MSVAPENALDSRATKTAAAAARKLSSSSSITATASAAAAVAPVKTKPSTSIIMRGLDVLSSVRFGVILLMILILLSFIGMIIMQQEVDGFDAYYTALTPAQRLLFGKLELFNIYHAWYFRLLLLVLSLNIVLASIDRFPKAWSFIKTPKLDAGLTWLRGQRPSTTVEFSDANREQAIERVKQAYAAVGFKQPRVTEKNNRTFVFAQRGAWNRLGAYAVHVALLTIFTGGFLTSYIGRTGQMKLSPDAASPSKRSSTMQQQGFDLDKLTRTDVKLPFTVECLDIEQQLIKKEGTIDASNTIDWLTRVKITDETGTHEATIHLNNPYDYRGYRMFQASYNPMGHARNITLRLQPQDGRPTETVTIPRGREATLSDGTRIAYINFYPDFFLNGAQPDSRSVEYANPAAQLRITPPVASDDGGGNSSSSSSSSSNSSALINAYAFAAELPDGAPVGAPVAGYKIRLVSFEKVPREHILSIQRDPGSSVFYAGSALLIATLIAVFFFSHQRVWASVGEAATGGYEAVIGANTNRNQQGLEDKFKRLVSNLRGETTVNSRDDED